MTALAVVAMLAGFAATALLLVLLVAAAPMSSRRQLLWLKALGGANAAVGLLGFGTAVLAFALGRHGLAAAAGVAPLPVALVLFVVMLRVGAEREPARRLVVRRRWLRRRASRQRSA